MSKSAYYLCVSGSVPSVSSVTGAVHRINWVRSPYVDVHFGSPYILCLYYKQQRSPQQWSILVNQNGWKPYQDPSAFQLLQSKTRGRHALECLRRSLFDDCVIDEWLGNSINMEQSDNGIGSRMGSSLVVTHPGTRAALTVAQPPMRKYGREAIAALSLLVSKTMTTKQYESDVQVAMAKLDFMVQASDILMAGLSGSAVSVPATAAKCKAKPTTTTTQYNAIEDAVAALTEISQQHLDASSSLYTIVSHCKQSVIIMRDLKQRLQRDRTNDTGKSKYISVSINKIIANTCSVATVRLHACIMHQLTLSKETLGIMPDVLTYVSAVYGICVNAEPKVTRAIEAIMTRVTPMPQSISGSNEDTRHSFKKCISMSQVMLFQYFATKLNRMEAARKFNDGVVSLQIAPSAVVVNPSFNLRATRIAIDEACTTLNTQTFIHLVYSVFKPTTLDRMEPTPNADAIINLSSSPNIVQLYRFLTQAIETFYNTCETQPEKTINNWVCNALRRHTRRMRINQL